jgi:hypothetical protein
MNTRTPFDKLFTAVELSDRFFNLNDKRSSHRARTYTINSFPQKELSGRLIIFGVP